MKYRSIARYINKKGMPYVDSAFLAKGMAWDKTFKNWQVGQQRKEADKWLELLNQASIIQKKVQPHPVNGDHEIDTWWLPDKPNMDDREHAEQGILQEPSASPKSDILKSAEPQSKDKSDLWKSLLGAPV